MFVAPEKAQGRHDEQKKGRGISELLQSHGHGFITAAYDTILVSVPPPQQKQQKTTNE